LIVKREYVITVIVITKFDYFLVDNNDNEVVHLNAFEGVDDGANGVADDEHDDDEHEHHRHRVIATLV